MDRRLCRGEADQRRGLEVPVAEEKWWRGEELMVDRLIGAFVVEATNARSPALCMTCYPRVYDDDGELSGGGRRGPACR